MKIIEGSVRMLELTDEQYFGDSLPGHISNSKMTLINPAQGGSPDKYQSGFDSKKSDALVLGSAIHALILEDEKYKLAEICAPSDTIKTIIDTAYKLNTREKGKMEFEEALDFAVKYHNYYGGKPGEKRMERLRLDTAEYYNFIKHNNDPFLVYLTPEMKATATRCLTALRENREAMDLLKPLDKTIISLNEKVLVAQIEFGDYVYNLKLKLDNAWIDPEMKTAKLNDLKTTGSPIHTFMGQTVLKIDPSIQSMKYLKHNQWDLSLQYTFEPGSFQKFHYYRQMYMYRMIFAEYVKLTYDIDLDFIETNMVVVETKNFRPKAEVFNVGENWMDLGKQEFKYLLGLIDYYETNGFDKNMELLEKNEVSSDGIDLSLDDSAGLDF